MGGGALHHMYQQVIAVLSTLGQGIGQELFVVGAEVQGNGDVPERRWGPFRERTRLGMELGGSLSWLPGEPGMENDIAQEQQGPDASGDNAELGKEISCLAK